MQDGNNENTKHFETDNVGAGPGIVLESDVKSQKMAGNLRARATPTNHARALHAHYISRFPIISCLVNYLEI